MAQNPNKFISPQAPYSAQCITSTANTTYSDTPTNTVLFMDGGVNGLRITEVKSLARATVTATLLQMFASSDGGTTKRLIRTVLMAADTLSTTDEFPPTDWGFDNDNPLIVAPNEEIYMGQSVTLASGIVHDARGGAY